MFMTKTGIENLKLKHQRQIADADREVKRSEAESRKVRANAAAKDASTRRGVGIADTILKGFSTVGNLVKSGAGAAKDVAGVVSLLNDPSWYKSIPELNHLVTSLPTFYPVGIGKTAELGPGRKKVPYLYTIFYQDSLGTQGATAAERAHNPVNLAMARLMTALRARNSRVGEYEPGDIGEVFISETDVFVQLLIIAKALRAVRTYDANKLQMGRMICEALGFDPDDAINNQQAYMATWNIIAQRVNENLVLPKNFNYAQRKIFLASAIYADDELYSSQAFMFRPIRVKKYDEANARVLDEDFSVAYGTQFYGRYTIGTALKYVQSCIDVLLYSTALQTMFADIRAGFDQSEFMTLPLIDTVETLYIPHTTEVLHQLMNIRYPEVVKLDNAGVIGGVVHTSNLFANWFSLFNAMLPNQSNILQDSDGLLYQNDILYSSLPENANAVTEDTLCLNFYTNDITSDDILVSTRLTPVFRKQATGSTPVTEQYYIEACGTEIPLFGAISIYEPPSANGTCLTYLHNGIAGMRETAAGLTLVDFLASYLSFDWMPGIKMYHDKQSNYGMPDVTKNWSWYNQPGNLVSINKDNLHILHDVSVQSEWYLTQVPFNGKITK